MIKIIIIEKTKGMLLGNLEKLKIKKNKKYKQYVCRYITCRK